jgi:hypothetical protein
MTSLYRVASLSAIGIAVGYTAIVAAYSIAGQRPADGQAWLLLLARFPTAWWTIIVLSIITDLLFLPVMAALHRALGGRSEAILRWGIALVLVFVLVDLAFTWPAFLSLMRASVRPGPESLSAADRAAAVIASPWLAIFIILVPGIGILLISLAMVGGAFGRATVVTGIATGILAAGAVMGPLFADALGLLAVPASILTLVWCLLVGLDLRRLG